MIMARNFQIALCTAPDLETAQHLARLMVEQQLAACVNLMPNIISVYQWQGEIEQESEVLMLIKTEEKLIHKLDDLLEQEHPYEVPELISCNIEQASGSYLQWLADSLKK